VPVYVICLTFLGSRPEIAKRHISNHYIAGFAIELPGGEAEPPGDACY